ncbi:hypothetical protein GCM10009837_43070 [Streptomyces durmitorensis]|uniref:DUF6519 domain-containing protein n=1 Tax=Streptomyces durmitorensis TaxID=319947 RepID=A0ABY4Q4Q6_9ACTN|nr:DUF6519 domain-containing protein [Streptomyces durmitorensis]UQT60680.1 DUF6519 domain-containing protein [Streptomyces durmitorensis]
MAGDYSSVGFDVYKHFSGVLMQQGRVQLDRDWNEQADILRHLLRSLAADLIGPHGGPGSGFEIGAPKDLPRDVTIAPGHYYVDGILCENDGVRDAPELPLPPCRYSRQPDLPSPPELEANGDYLVYLDVWEREVVALQDDTIRETALGGPDTTARSQVVWQVKALSVKDDKDFDPGRPDDHLRASLPASTGRLRVRARPLRTSDDPCIASPDARYRGLENQLYRIEIHRSGPPGQATFTWSRENASVVLAVSRVTDRSVTLESLGRDERSSLHVNDQVEVIDDNCVLQGGRGPLFRVDGVSADDRSVELDGRPPLSDADRHPLLRRWDHREPADGDLIDGALPLDAGTWLDLEDGVQVWFEAGGNYRSGDHWLVPARTATGEVVWPGPPDSPEYRPPLGVRHHYAPLQRISLDPSGRVSLDRTYRRTIKPSAS